MNKYKLKYKPLGSIAVLIEWPKEIKRDILENINVFKHKILADMGEYVLETVPAYNSLAVFFDTTKIKYSSVVTDLKEIYTSKDQKLLTAYKLWKIPVCYEPEFGLDLEHLAQAKKMTKEEVVQLHSSQVYDIYFIGFLPGFWHIVCHRPTGSLSRSDAGLPGPNRPAPQVYFEREQWRSPEPSSSPD